MSHPCDDHRCDYCAICQAGECCGKDKQPERTKPARKPKKVPA